MKKQGYPELQHLICPRFKGTQDILREVRMQLPVLFDTGSVCLLLEVRHRAMHLLPCVTGSCRGLLVLAGARHVQSRL